MKSYATLKVDPRVHDEVLQYAGELQAAEGRRVTASEAVGIMLEQCRVKKTPKAGKPVKRGKGRPHKFYTDVGDTGLEKEGGSRE
jgi:hypothetical protein